jgi:glutamate synthase (NADPH) small chain
MGKTTGFMDHSRELALRRPVLERVNDWFEIYQDFPEEKLREQGARCMDCGVPFCQTGCPVSNLIPDWNDLVYRGRWKEAVRQLHATNNFPEFTGRICPAPCEAACVLGINQPPVTIKQNEKNIVERGFLEGWIRPERPKIRTGKKVAIVGSGPAGLAAAQQLCRAGHTVSVYEKNDRIGGLLRYGIPEFKLEKHIIDRRLEQMSAEGVKFVTNAEVGGNVAVEELRREFDAIVLAGGAEQPRDLKVPGRELKGIYFAMEFLPQQNKRCQGETFDPALEIRATGKRVVIIGGGDTGADCLGTCHRQKPISVHQFEIMSKPPDQRSPHTPWPLWPMQLRIEAAHEEGGVRDWSIATTAFSGDDNGNVRQLHAVRVGSAPNFEPTVGTQFVMDADLVLIAMGFLGPIRNGMIEQLGVQLDDRGNVVTDQNHMSSVPGVFAAGDMRRGQSLVVWAIAEGRKAAACVDAYLQSTNATDESNDKILTIENGRVPPAGKQLPESSFRQQSHLG